MDNWEGGELKTVSVTDTVYVRHTSSDTVATTTGHQFVPIGKAITAAYLEVHIDFYGEVK